MEEWKGLECSYRKPFFKFHMTPETQFTSDSGSVSHLSERTRLSQSHWWDCVRHLSVDWGRRNKCCESLLSTSGEPVEVNKVKNEIENS